MNSPNLALGTGAASSATPEPSRTFTPTLAPSDTSLPTETERPSTTPLPSPTIEVCTNKAEFVRHLSISDNTKMVNGTYFAKVWRIRNIGTCTWTPQYTFVFEGGADFNSPQETPLIREVKPGETIDIQVTLLTPDEPATHTANWMLEDPAGNQFGSGEHGDLPFTAVIVVEEYKLNERKETLACG